MPLVLGGRGGAALTREVPLRGCGRWETSRASWGPFLLISADKARHTYIMGNMVTNSHACMVLYCMLGRQWMLQWLRGLCQSRLISDVLGSDTHDVICDQEAPLVIEPLKKEEEKRHDIILLIMLVSIDAAGQTHVPSSQRGSPPCQHPAPLGWLARPPWALTHTHPPSR